MGDPSSNIEQIAEGPCPECGGIGWAPVPVARERCCGRSDWECGGRGCTGPEQRWEQEQQQCEYCRGSGTVEISGEQIEHLTTQGGSDG